MTANSTPNARFWFYNHHCQWTKLTLRPGQVLHWHKWARDEEGWSSQSEEFTHEGDQVRWVSVSDGVDCDGRLRRGAELTCPLALLQTGRSYEGEMPIPEWHEAEAWQRDYRAEAAGY